MLYCGGIAKTDRKYGSDVGLVALGDGHPLVRE